MPHDVLDSLLELCVAGVLWELDVDLRQEVADRVLRDVDYIALWLNSVSVKAFMSIL